MKLPSSAILSLLVCSTILCSASAALADPPAEVGRISYTEGNITFHAPDLDWAPAPLNYPVVEGSSYWADANSKAEIQIGPMELRMAPSTEIDISHLDDQLTQIQVPQGTVNLHLLNAPAVPLQVITPTGEIDISQAGSYHIDAGNPATNTSAAFTVLEGEGQFATAAGTETVYAGETATVTGAPPQFVMQEGSATAFDNWALARERREMAAANNYVSAQMTGANDLNYNGQWTTAPAYGAIWYPTSVPANWAPYRYGHWAYVAPWGWTWIDNAAWGFAPFHYGRWIQADGRWGWCPGEHVERPVYAPALVAFIGGLNLSVSAGAPVGWVPLGPHEAFHPYYAVSAAYVRNINIANVNKTEINNITVNRNVTINSYANYKAATVVPTSSFASGAAVHTAALHVTPEQLAHAQAGSGFSHIRPMANALPHAGGQNNHPAIARPPEITHTMPAAGAFTTQHFEHPAVVPTPAEPPRPPSHPTPALEQPHATQLHPQESRPAETRPAETRPVQPEKVPASSAEIREHEVVPHEPVRASEPHSAPMNNVSHPVQHPAQQTQIHPTPQGWARSPKEESHAPAHETPKHPEGHPDEHEEHHPQ